VGGDAVVAIGGEIVGADDEVDRARIGDLDVRFLVRGELGQEPEAACLVLIFFLVFLRRHQPDRTAPDRIQITDRPGVAKQLVVTGRDRGIATKARLKRIPRGPVIRIQVVLKLDIPQRLHGR
jgi:hypothetical protein